MTCKENVNKILKFFFYYIRFQFYSISSIIIDFPQLLNFCLLKSIFSITVKIFNCGRLYSFFFNCGRFFFDCIRLLLLFLDNFTDKNFSRFVWPRISHDQISFFQSFARPLTVSTETKVAVSQQTWWLTYYVWWDNHSTKKSSTNWSTKSTQTVSRKFYRLSWIFLKNLTQMINRKFFKFSTISFARFNKSSANLSHQVDERSDGTIWTNLIYTIEKWEKNCSWNS